MNKQLGQGRINTIEYLKEQPKLAKELEDKIRKQILDPEPVKKSTK